MTMPSSDPDTPPKLPVNRKRAERTHVDSSPSVAALVAGWFAYGPLSELVGVKGAGHGDEAIALSAGLAAALIAGAHNRISAACSDNIDYKHRIVLGSGGGAALGAASSATIGAFVLPAIDLATTGGIVTASSVLFGGTALGAVAGNAAAKKRARKRCRNGHWGDCCERICRECACLFTPNADWYRITTEEDAKKFSSDRMTFYDIVSIFHYRGFNYIEACGVLRRCGGSWEVEPTVPLEDRKVVPTIDRTAFFTWFDKHESKLTKLKHSRVIDDVWGVAEYYVRSDCKPNERVELSSFPDGVVPKNSVRKKPKLTSFAT